MSNIVPFNFESNSVRTIQGEDGEPWFVLADICKALELSNPSAVAARLDDDEKAKSDLGSGSPATIVNEPGLYSVVMRSDKTEAKAFKRWIRHEVLPSIRKTGKYAVQMTQTEIIAAQAQQLVEIEHRQKEIDERTKRIEARQEMMEKGFHDFSILAYSRYREYPPLDIKTASALGKTAAKLCRERGFPIGSIRDPRFGTVNTYPEEVLEEVFRCAFSL